MLLCLWRQMQPIKMLCNLLKCGQSTPSILYDFIMFRIDEHIRIFIGIFFCSEIFPLVSIIIQILSWNVVITTAVLLQYKLMNDFLIWHV
jgi:hypothetical protein